MSKSKGHMVSAEIKSPKPSITTDSKKERQQALAAIVKGTQKGASAVESDLSRLLDKALESNSWDWPRPTARRNGTYAGKARNIVDTGKLKGSKKLTTKFLKTKTVFNVSYLAPYAWMTHEGGYIRPFGRTDIRAAYIPGRPWIKAVVEGGVSGIESIDIESIMQAAVPAVWG